MCIGWLATMPTTTPETRAKPTMTLRAKVACTSKSSPLSTMRRMTACMSIGSAGLDGIRSLMPWSGMLSIGIARLCGGSSVLFDGRKVRRCLTRRWHAGRLRR